MSTYATNIPGASGYANASLLATNAYNNALARLNQKRMGTLRDYGYTADVNSGTGVLDNLRVDSSNPYGQYQSLLRSGASDSMAAQDNAAGRGLHGGLAQQLQDDAKYTFGANSQQLGRGLNDTLGGYQDEQNTAAYSRDNALWQAQHQAELEANAAGAYNQGDYSGLDTGGYGDENAPPTDGTGNPFTGTGPGEHVDQAAWDAYVKAHAPDAVDNYVKNHPAPKPKAKASGGGGTRTTAGVSPAVKAKVIQKVTKKGGK